MNVTVHVDTAPAEDFGSEPPVFGGAPATATTAEYDPNRPMRRARK